MPFIVSYSTQQFELILAQGPHLSGVPCPLPLLFRENLPKEIASMAAIPELIGSISSIVARGLLSWPVGNKSGPRGRKGL